MTFFLEKIFNELIKNIYMTDIGRVTSLIKIV